LRVVDGMAALCRRLAIYSGSFRQQLTVVEIIIGDMHCLSNADAVLAYVSSCNCCCKCGL